MGLDPGRDIFLQVPSSIHGIDLLNRACANFLAKNTSANRSNAKYKV